MPAIARRQCCKPSAIFSHHLISFRFNPQLSVKNLRLLGDFSLLKVGPYKTPFGNKIETTGPLMCSLSVETLVALGFNREQTPQPHHTLEAHSKLQIGLLDRIEVKISLTIVAIRVRKSHRALTEEVSSASKWSAHMPRIYFLSITNFPLMRKAVICEVDHCSFKSLQNSFSLEYAALQSLVIFSP